MTGAIPTVESRDAVTSRLDLLVKTSPPQTLGDWIRSVDARLSRLSKQARGMRRWVQIAIAISLLSQHIKAEDITRILSALNGVP